jgi:hypothetical protein
MSIDQIIFIVGCSAGLSIILACIAAWAFEAVREYWFYRATKEARQELEDMAAKADEFHKTQKLRR